MNRELSNHPTLSLLQSKFITAFRHILVFIDRETGEQIMVPLMDSYAAVKKIEEELYIFRWKISLIY